MFLPHNLCYWAWAQILGGIFHTKCRKTDCGSFGNRFSGRVMSALGSPYIRTHTEPYLGVNVTVTSDCESLRLLGLRGTVSPAKGGAKEHNRSSKGFPSWADATDSTVKNMSNMGKLKRELIRLSQFTLSSVMNLSSQAQLVCWKEVGKGWTRGGKWSNWGFYVILGRCLTLHDEIESGKGFPIMSEHVPAGSPSNRLHRLWSYFTTQYMPPHTML